MPPHARPARHETARQAVEELARPAFWLRPDAAVSGPAWGMRRRGRSGSRHRPGSGAGVSSPALEAGPDGSRDPGGVRGLAGHAGGCRSARRMDGSPSLTEPPGPYGGHGGPGGRASALWRDRRRIPPGSPRVGWGGPGPRSRARPSPLRALGHSTDGQPGLRHCPSAAKHAGAQGGPATGGGRSPAGACLLFERRLGAGNRAGAVCASGKAGGRRRSGGCDGERGT